MRIIVYSAQDYDIRFLNAANSDYGFEIKYIDSRLDPHSAQLSASFDCACLFVNDRLNADTAQIMHGAGVRLIALRCAGFNNVDLEYCDKIGLTVVHVPAYSPWAVAEHTVGLMLALNR